MVITPARRLDAGVAAVLAEAGLADRMDRIRRREGLPFAPWPFPGSATPRDPAHALLTRALADADTRKAVEAGLRELDVLAPDCGAGLWSVTGHRGVLAVQDLGSADPAVYIGPDSLRFASFLQDRHLVGDALDVGGGSGISACRLAVSCSKGHSDRHHS